MPKIEITRTELVWPGKYDDEANLVPTRRDRSLKLKTAPHTYDKPGTYNILVKVIDIFGIDTSQLFEV